MLQCEARGNVGRSAKPVYAEAFPFQLWIGGNRFNGNDLESEGVDDAGDHDQIGTGEIAAHNGRPTDDSNRNFSGQQRGYSRWTTGNKKQFNIKAVLSEDSGFLSDPYRCERTSLGAVADVQLFEFRL